MEDCKVYKLLDLPDTELVEMKIEYGGLSGRVLSAANPSRTINKRTCSVDIVDIMFKEPLSCFFDNKRLKEMVFHTVKNITEMCELFVPSKTEVTDPIVEAYLNGEIA